MTNIFYLILPLIQCQRKVNAKEYRLKGVPKDYQYTSNLGGGVANGYFDFST